MGKMTKLFRLFCSDSSFFHTCLKGFESDKGSGPLCSSKQLQIIEPCVLTFCLLFWALFDLIVAFGKRSISAVCPGTPCHTHRFLETSTGEGKKAIPAMSLPAQLFVTTWWCIYLICFCAGLFVEIYSFEEDEFLPKCVRFWWGIGPCCPFDGNLRWNFQISFNPVLRKHCWSPTKNLLFLHTIFFLSTVPLFSPFSCSNTAIGFPYSPFLFGIPVQHIMFLWKLP